jgi:signal transduction histidine kinase/DNA-binding response OmpR family regulator/ligand-binding sensor domain-containing protein
MKTKTSFFTVFFSLTIFLSITRFCYSQTYRFNNFSSAEGYTGIGSQRIVQDSLGFLWIKTVNGLFRFDGYNFKSYGGIETDSLWSYFGWGVPTIDPWGNLWIYDDHLRAFSRDLDDFIIYSPDHPKGGGGFSSWFDPDKETVWIGWYGQGLTKYNTRTNEATTYPIDGGLPIAGIRDRGSYFLVTTERGLWKFDKKKKKFFRPPYNKRDSSVLADAAMFIADEKDHYWIKSFEKDDRVLLKLDTNLNVIQRVDVSVALKKFDPKGIAPQMPDDWVDRDRDGKFWIATIGLGLFKYDPMTNEMVNIRHDPDDPFSLASDRLLSVMVDRDQNIWVASDDRGLSQLKRQSLYFYNYLRGSVVNDLEFLTTDKGHYLITAGKTGSKTAHYSGSLGTLDFKNFAVPPAITESQEVSAVYVGRSKVWFTSEGGIVGVAINKNTGAMEHGTPLVMKARHYADPNENLISHPYIMAVYEDKSNKLWVGTGAGHGLNRVDLSVPYGKPGSVEHFWHDEKDSTSIAFAPFLGNIYPENDSALWITTTPGLELYSNGRFYHINRNIPTTCIKKLRNGTIALCSKEGFYIGQKEKDQYHFDKVDLVGNILVGSIEEDQLGRLWLGTLQGLYCYNRTEKSLLHFKEQDGLLSSRARVRALPDGRIAAATPNGISIFDPMALNVSREKIKPVFLMLKVNNELASGGSKESRADNLALPHDVNVLDEVVFDYKHNIFSLEFAALELTAPEKNLYAYKLEGFNEEWVYTDAKNRVATYTNLDPGRYTFKVKASSRDGVWSDHETALNIRVLPPPWKTWWAYTCYSFIFGGLMLLARKSILQQERLKTNLKLAKVEQEKEHFELEKAKEVDKLKSAFFTNISHEFRTPLTLIKGPVDTLLEEYASNPRTKEQLKLVERNSDLLLKLINQLMDRAKLESGSLTVEKTEGDLNSFLMAIANSFSSLALQKNIRLTIEPPAIKCVALFDKDKLETILINLINNAIKFTSPTGIVLVRFQWEDPSNTQKSNGLIISVSDTGIGIPADQQTKIFERFHQVSDAHREVGTGIGLSLVKELVSLMEGTLSLKSELGKGSEFTIVLPIEIVRDLSRSEEIVENVSSTTMEVGLRGKLPVNESENGTQDDARARLLVVEDNDDLRSFIISSLGGEFQFLEARDGKEGMEKAFDEVPDLIISDVMMPEMDGITMTKRIKRDTRTSHIPLILLTAKTSEENKLSGLETGADDYLTKPFNRNELLLKVRNRISLQLKLRERIRLELLKESPNVEVQSADEKFLMKVKETILKRMDDEQLSVESLAEEIGLSRSQLFRKITALTGISVNELIRTFRLQKAAQLLEQNWGPVAQVAYEVGFSNLSYFAKVFKEQYGVLPSEYGAKVH